VTPKEKDMLNHPTLDQLNQLGLFGGANVYRERQALTIAKAFAEILASGDASTLTLAEGLGLRLDREGSYRNDKRLAARLRYAKLRHQAAVEDRGNRGWPVHSAIRPVGTIAQCSMPGCRSCSMSWRLPAATAAMPG
jgi:hypothetical protein